MHAAGPFSLPLVVGPDDLADLVARDPAATILDVRTPAEFALVHIPGSYNVPLGLLPEHATELRTAVGGPIVLVCRSGARASQAEQTLRAAALPRLHVLDGGLAAWEAADRPLTRGRQRWSLERQVRGAAGGLALAGALAGLFVWQPLGAIAAGIGGGLLFSAVTDTCTMAKLLTKLPYNRGASCDIAAVVRELRRAAQPTTSAAGEAAGYAIASSSSLR